MLSTSIASLLRGTHVGTYVVWVYLFLSYIFQVWIKYIIYYNVLSSNQHTLMKHIPKGV